MVRAEFSENMETASSNEPLQRLALGGVYNHLLMFGQLGEPADNAENRPLGPLTDALAQFFTDFEGFKEDESSYAEQDSMLRHQDTESEPM